MNVMKAVESLHPFSLCEVELCCFKLRYLIYDLVILISLTTSEESQQELVILPAANA